MKAGTKSMVRPLAHFALALLLGVGVAITLRAPLVAASCKVMNTLLLDHLSFGPHGHARLRPAPAPGADAVAALSLDGYSGELTLAFSLRRDLLLPTVLLLAALAAAPLPARRKGLCVGLGLPLLFLASAASIVLLILWSFTFTLRDGVTLGETGRLVLDAAHRALLLPPANRFVFPLVLAGALTVWQHLAARGAARIAASDASVPGV